eukprot:PhM_4_TR7437/c0_g1_i1/m.39219
MAKLIVLVPDVSQFGDIVRYSRISRVLFTNETKTLCYVQWFDGGFGWTRDVHDVEDDVTVDARRKDLREARAVHCVEMESKSNINKRRKTTASDHVNCGGDDNEGGPPTTLRERIQCQLSCLSKQKPSVPPPGTVLDHIRFIDNRIEAFFFDRNDPIESVYVHVDALSEEVRQQHSVRAHVASCVEAISLERAMHVCNQVMCERYGGAGEKKAYEATRRKLELLLSEYEGVPTVAVLAAIAREHGLWDDSDTNALWGRVERYLPASNPSDVSCDVAKKLSRFVGRTQRMPTSKELMEL